MPALMANLRCHTAKGLGKFTAHMQSTVLMQERLKHHQANHHKKNSCSISPVREK